MQLFFKGLAMTDTNMRMPKVFIDKFKLLVCKQTRWMDFFVLFVSYLMHRPEGKCVE